MRHLAALGLLLSAALAHAGSTDALPSCYIKALPHSAAPDTELFVAIDQTTPLDLSLRQAVADSIRPFLTPNHGFSLLTFSAYTQGHYTEVVTGGKLDRLLSPEQRNDVPKAMLLKFDMCMQRQPQQAAALVGNALRTIYGGTSSDIAKSDVLASLKAISGMVRQSSAKDRIVLIVSDMLENSSITNFYADKGKSVRRIDPVRELDLVETNQLLGDFGGARVYVIGAGLLAEDANKAKIYRDTKTMQALGNFWSGYLSKSKAQLVEFGQPALLKPVQ
jgi:hypothetical protein